MSKRSEIQYEATKVWVDNNKIGTLIIPTGVGKSKIGVDIVGKQLTANVITSALIVVPTTNLIEQWKQEFLKWNYSLVGIDFLCIQTAHKVEAKNYDILIIDEVHTATSEVYSNVFENIKYAQILGLTATIPESDEAKLVLSKYCPIVYIKTLTEIAGEEGIIATTNTFNIPIKLNRKDKAKYNTFNEQFMRAMVNIGVEKKKRPELTKVNIFDLARDYSSKIVPEEDKILQKYCKAYWAAMTMRKNVCYSAESKIPYVQSIIEQFPNRKWILFNKSIKFAELLSSSISNSRVYHSKQKDEERAKILEDFSTGEFNVLIAVDALNAGLNIPDTDSAICVSGVSTELVAIQQSGRVSRFLEGKQAIFINLYAENTIEKSWVEKKTKNLPNVHWIENHKLIQQWLQ